MHSGVIDFSWRYDSISGVTILKSMTQHSPFFPLFCKDTSTNKRSPASCFNGFLGDTTDIGDAGFVAMWAALRGFETVSAQLHVYTVNTIYATCA